MSNLANQLNSALDAAACFCISCGQPDEPKLHDPARCPACGGTVDTVTVADALDLYDQSCIEEPDLDDHARALHCAIVGLRAGREEQQTA